MGIQEINRGAGGSGILSGSARAYPSVRKREEARCVARSNGSRRTGVERAKSRGAPFVLQRDIGLCGRVREFVSSSLPFPSLPLKFVCLFKQISKI